MALVGEIFFDKKFEFTDGEVGEKLFLIIYVDLSKDIILVLKTTSQKKRYLTVNSKGCHSEKKVLSPPTPHNFSTLAIVIQNV